MTSDAGAGAAGIEGAKTMTISHDNEPKSNALRLLMDQYVGHAQSTWTPTQIVVSRAKGRCLWTADGRRLIDFTSGVLVSNIGYAHRGFERRLADYCKGLPRNAYNMVTEIQIEASRRLVKSMRGNAHAQRTLWAASGSEGIQKAMWAALHHHPERHIMVATRGGFHGKKGLAADVSGERSANPNVRFISFPMGGGEPESFYRAELDAIWREAPDKVALLITEPYLGAKGSFHPPKWYHRMLEQWCREHGVPFIFDEVQACFGRTGSMYAWQSYGVQPDLVVLGKGVASGVPASVVVGRADLIGALGYGEASDTFSGVPEACAAVCATLDVFEEEKVVAHARRAAKWLRRGLDTLQKQFPFILEVRGEGLVFGLDMADTVTADACVLEAYRARPKRGVHFLGPLAGKVLRVSPPLTITRDEVDEAVEMLAAAWSRVG